MGYKLKVQGLCGRIRQPPPKLLQDEIIKIHTDNGWQLGGTMARPEGPQAGDLVQTKLFYVKVDPDGRISDPKTTQAAWTAQQAIGIGLGVIVVLGIIITALMDCFTDRYLRAANKYTM